MSADLWVAGAALLLIYGVNCFSRTVSRRKKSPEKQRRRRRGVRYSAFALSLGMALQNLEGLIRPVEYLLQEKYEQDADEDDQGDPDSPKAQINRQLKRIRRGELVDRLILKLK